MASCWLDQDRTTASRQARRVEIAPARRVAAPFTLLPQAAVAVGHRQHDQRRVSGSKEDTMTSDETTTATVMLQLDEQLLAQLRPYLEGLEITIAPHSEWGYQAVYEQGQFAGYARVERPKQRLTMRRDIYDTLITRVNDALDYDVRWQPNEYEPDGFVERVRPLELTNGILAPANCPQCGTCALANRAEVACACGQVVSLI
jgi:hypothetical protein